MKQLFSGCLWALTAAGMLSLSACSSAPFVPPTPAPIKTTPAACLTPCDPIPEPASPAAQDLQRWELEVVQSHERCSRLHEECRAGVLRRLAE